MDASAPLRLAHFVALLLLGVVVLAAVASLTLRARAAGWPGRWGWAWKRWASSIAVLRAFGLRSAGALVLSVTLLVVFVNVAEDVAEQQTGVVDEHVRQFAQAHRTPALDRFFSTVTWFGETWVQIATVLLVALLLNWRRNRRTALLAVVAPVLGAITIVAVKNTFRRARPAGAIALGVHTYSFPSGHATGSAATLLTIGYVLARERLLPWWSVPLGAVGTLLIGSSRVYLDAHWATDVMGGWAVGTGFALAGVGLYEHLRRRDRRHDAEERAAQGGDPGERRREPREATVGR